MEIIKVILTSLLSAAVLFLLAKIMGHKQISQLDFFDYITGITIGSIAAELATEADHRPPFHRGIRKGPCTAADQSTVQRAYTPASKKGCCHYKATPRFCQSEIGGMTMTPIITKPLSREEAATIFAENAVFLGKADAIGAHRMVELFGEPAARWIERNTHHGGYLIPGTDYNASGSCAPDDPCLDYYYLSGFLKVVSNHNHRLQVAAHIQSEGGAIWDDVWEERCARLAAQDAKDAAEAVKEANAAVKEAKATAKAASAAAAEAEAKRKNRRKKN